MSVGKVEDMRATVEATRAEIEDTRAKIAKALPGLFADPLSGPTREIQRNLLIASVIALIASVMTQVARLYSRPIKFDEVTLPFLKITGVSSNSIAIIACFFIAYFLLLFILRAVPDVFWGVNLEVAVNEIGAISRAVEVKSQEKLRHLETNYNHFRDSLSGEISEKRNAHDKKRGEHDNLYNRYTDDDFEGDVESIKKQIDLVDGELKIIDAEIKTLEAKQYQDLERFLKQNAYVNMSREIAGHLQQRLLDWKNKHYLFRGFGKIVEFIFPILLAVAAVFSVVWPDVIPVGMFGSPEFEELWL